MARKHNFAFAAVALLLVPAVGGARRNQLQMQTGQLVGTWAVVNPRLGSSWSVEFDSDGSYIASPIPRVSWPYRTEGDHFEISLEEKHGKPLWNRQLLHVTKEQKVEISDPSCGVSVQMNRLIELSHDPGGIEGMWRLEELTDEGIVKCKGLLPFIGFSTAEFSHDGTVILGASPIAPFEVCTN